LRKVLIVTFRFAPSAASGTFRSLGFVRHLSAMGWQIEVLTIKKSMITDTDDKLLKKVPAGVKIIRAAVFDPFRLWGKLRHQSLKNDLSLEKTESQDLSVQKSKQSVSFKEKLSHFLKTPDNQIGWFFPALSKLFKLSKPSLVYSSAPPFTGHLIAVVLKKIWRIPLVCDFRDPWLDNPFRLVRPGWVEKWERGLEKWVYKNADMIIANTEPMAEAFKERHSEAALRIHVITNGYDPDDFEGITSKRDISSDLLLMVHPGSLYGQRDPRCFLEAVRCAVFDHGCDQLRVQLIGPSENFGGKSLADHVESLELQDYIEIINSVSHQEALERMKGADYLLIFSQGTKLQVPAKIYEYMGLEKAIFAITERESATEMIMSSLGDNHFSCTNKTEEITENLVAAYELFLGKQQGAETEFKDNTSSYLRSRLSEQLDDVFVSILEKGHR
jgi:glycosyltransferase involved in cell wall biosynthesis